MVGGDCSGRWSTSRSAVPHVWAAGARDVFIILIISRPLAVLCLLRRSCLSARHAARMIEIPTRSSLNNPLLRSQAEQAITMPSPPQFSRSGPSAMHLAVPVTVNPFSIRPMRYTPLTIAKMCLVGVTLFPIRVVSLLASLVGLAAVAAISTAGHDARRPMVLLESRSRACLLSLCFASPSLPLCPPLPLLTQTSQSTHPPPLRSRHGGVCWSRPPSPSPACCFGPLASGAFRWFGGPARPQRGRRACSRPRRTTHSSTPSS